MIVGQFSCGAASAVAIKLTLAKYPKEQVKIVNAFVLEEHEDNRRFLLDCERWFDHPIKVIRNEKYNASTDEVWKRKRYIKGAQGAPCSAELKRDLLRYETRANDTLILGFTVEEQDRLDAFIDANNDVRVETPLIEYGLTKRACFSILDRAGIKLPAMYDLGFSNANCIGCPKGGENYWKRIRKVFPQRFVQIQGIQETIGPGAYFLRFRSGPRKNERMSLAELPLGDGNMGEELDFSCGVACQWAEKAI